MTKSNSRVLNWDNNPPLLHIHKYLLRCFYFIIISTHKQEMRGWKTELEAGGLMSESLDHLENHEKGHKNSPEGMFWGWSHWSLLFSWATEASNQRGVELRWWDHDLMRYTIINHNKKVTLEKLKLDSESQTYLKKKKVHFLPCPTNAKNLPLSPN